MNTKQRAKELKNSDAMHFADIILWCLCAAWCFMLFAGLITSEQLGNEDIAAMVLVPLFMGMLRIRMLVRAIRVDALLREDDGTS